MVFSHPEKDKILKLKMTDFAWAKPLLTEQSGVIEYTVDGQSRSSAFTRDPGTGWVAVITVSNADIAKAAGKVQLASAMQAPTLKSNEINVETIKGVVQLSGFVGSQEEINAAAEVARKVNGVTEVRNDVQIKMASNATKEGTGEFVDNAAVTAKVKAALLKDPTLKSSEISVETFKGVVQLSGLVGYQSESDSAAKLAAKVEGVKSVKNDLRIKGNQ